MARYHLQISTITSYSIEFVVEFLTDGTWEVRPHLFWTLPCEYKYMPDYAPDLYELLSRSALVIFKGDLNYRLEVLFSFLTRQQFLHHISVT